MSDTPETDKAERMAFSSEYMVPTELARKLERERDELQEALKCLDEAIRLMKPRYIGHPTMDGRYPCWVVWLPKGGKVERKSLRDAFLEFFAQIKEAAKSQTC